MHILFLSNVTRHDFMIRSTSVNFALNCTECKSRYMENVQYSKKETSLSAQTASNDLVSVLDFLNMVGGFAQTLGNTCFQIRCYCDTTASRDYAENLSEKKHHELVCRSFFSRSHVTD